MKAIQFNTTIKANVPLKAAFFSDGHIDNPNFDQSTFEEHAHYCLEEQRYMLFGGDLFDSIIRTDKKRAVNSLLEHGDNQLNIKLDKAYELLKPYLSANMDGRLKNIIATIQKVLANSGSFLIIFSKNSNGQSFLLAKPFISIL